MNIKNRIQLIGLMSEELTDTATIYEKAAREHNSNPGYGGVTNFESKESIKRRITHLRAELMELSKQLD